MEGHTMKLKDVDEVLRTRVLASPHLLMPE
jgi:hypothetical protein